MANTLSALERENQIQRLQSEEFDLAIIGGGINGAGVARDATSRGMKVALIEAADFAEGTSSRSSKLIHGGIRYLENLEFHLVFEALSERQILFEIAPHLVHPLRFFLPLFRGGRVGMTKMGLGMWLYDALSLFDAPEMHQRRDPQETLLEMPFLRSQDLLGSYSYYDAYMDDDRLVLESLRSAVAQGAVCTNFVKATGARMEEGKIQALQCQSEKDSFEIKAKHFVSTVGPWTDELGKTLFKSWQPILRPTKGIHLTFSRKRFPLPDAVVMAAESRIVFGIPRHEMVIVGTTDTNFSGDPRQVHSTADEVRYLIEVTRRYFPGVGLEEKDILASYSGVRPLVNDGAATEGKTSREHLILRDPHNVTFMAGGKYTTYRLMAQQCVDKVLENFSTGERIRFQRSTTKKPLNPLVTTEAMERELRHLDKHAQEYGIPTKVWRQLVERHGSEAHELAMRSCPENEQELWLAEAEFAIHHTMCLNLRDFFLRRSPLFLARADHGWDLIPSITQVFAQELGWSSAQQESQIEALQQHLQKEMSWRIK